MTNYTIKVETCHINLSPTVFKLTAQDFFKCYLDFKKVGEFSLVPFFLCCRALELALKAMHLESKSQVEVKSLYRHDLLLSYAALPLGKITLSESELNLLTQANNIYVSKEFEYTNVFDAATAYKRFPGIDELASLTKKVINFSG